MATKPAKEDTRLALDTADKKALLHDFVYRDDMSVEDISQHLNRDWGDTYNWLNDQLKDAKDDEK